MGGWAGSGRERSIKARSTKITVCEFGSQSTEMGVVWIAQHNIIIMRNTYNTDRIGTSKHTHARTHTHAHVHIHCTHSNSISDIRYRIYMDCYLKTRLLEFHHSMRAHPTESNQSTASVISDGIVGNWYADGLTPEWGQSHNSLSEQLELYEKACPPSYLWDPASS